MAGSKAWLPEVEDVVMEVDVDVIVQYVITMVLMTRFVKQIIGITL